MTGVIRYLLQELYFAAEIDFQLVPAHRLNRMNQKLFNERWFGSPQKTTCESHSMINDSY